MGPQLDSCGRGGTAGMIPEDPGLQWGRNLTVAEGLVRILSPLWISSASMGPQLDSCGRLDTSSMERPEMRGFNGAAT